MVLKVGARLCPAEGRVEVRNEELVFEKEEEKAPPRWRGCGQLLDFRKRDFSVNLSREEGGNGSPEYEGWSRRGLKYKGKGSP